MWIHRLVKSLCHNIPRRWTLDLPQSDCGLFLLGFIYFYASSFPFLMVNIFIVKSTLSGIFHLFKLGWGHRTGAIPSSALKLFLALHLRLTTSVVQVLNQDWLYCSRSPNEWQNQNSKCRGFSTSIYTTNTECERTA